MKVLVTGGAGFLGSHVTRLLLDEGKDVRVMVQPGAPTRLVDGLDLECVEADLLDRAQVRRAVEGCREIYHLAALYAVWHPTPELIWRVNVEGTRHVMEAALAVGDVEKVVHTSSIAAIGIVPGRELADESTAFNAWSVGNEYVLSKYASELEALAYVRRGLPVVVVNPAFPFGERDIGPTPTGEIIVNALKGRVPGYLEGGFNAVYAGDVARGHLLAADRGRVGERYILGGANVTNREFQQAIARVSGVRIPDRRMSPRLVRGVARASEWIAAATGRPPITTVKAVAYLDGRYVFLDTRRAREELGLEPTPLDESLERAIRWFRDEGYA